MALNLGSVKKSYAPQSGGGSESVAVQIAEVHLADQSKRTANPAEDYAIAYILEDAFGKKAEFDEKNSALTAIKLKMRPRPHLTGEYQPMEIFDLQVGKRKGSSAPMGEWPTVILERAYLDNRTDTVMANWLHVVSRSNLDTLNRCISGMVSVDAERYNMKDNVREYYQDRHAAHPERAATFDDMDSFKAAAADFLTRKTEYGDGKPMVMIRIVNNASFEAGKVPEIANKIIFATTHEEGGIRVPDAGEDIVDRWVADEANAEWVSFINQAKSETDYTFELIPIYRYSTGKESLPSKKGKGRDDADDFAVTKEDRDNGYAPIRKNNGEPAVTSGFAAGSMIAKRQNDTDAGWYSIKTLRKTGFGPIFMRDELVTPNIPANVKAEFERLAKARGDALRNKVTKSSQPASEAAQDDEIPFGEPDHSGGLTPN